MGKSVQSVNMDEGLWQLVKTEAERRGISQSALISTIIADKLRPSEDVMLEAFKVASNIATLGMAPWKQKPKPSS